MKIERRNLANLSKSGMTLIEVTVVILVLLILIGVLFIATERYKKGADRAACLLTIRNFQQAVRANQNLNGYRPGLDELRWNEIVGTGRYIEQEPFCPTDGEQYALDDYYPEVGGVAAACVGNGVDGTSPGSARDHFPDPDEIVGW